MTWNTLLQLGDAREKEASCCQAVECSAVAQVRLDCLGVSSHLGAIPARSGCAVATNCFRSKRGACSTVRDHMRASSYTQYMSRGVRMGRSIDQDVHAAFVEFRAKGNTIHYLLN